MSKIYKLNYIVDNKIKKIYVCSNKKLSVNNGNLFDEEKNQVFSNEQLKYIQENDISYEIIKINIYEDDTIQNIKGKSRRPPLLFLLFFNRSRSARCFARAIKSSSLVPFLHPNNGADDSS